MNRRMISHNADTDNHVCGLIVRCEPWDVHVNYQFGWIASHIHDKRSPAFSVICRSSCTKDADPNDISGWNLFHRSYMKMACLSHGSINEHQGSLCSDKLHYNGYMRNAFRASVAKINAAPSWYEIWMILDRSCSSHGHTIISKWEQNIKSG